MLLPWILLVQTIPQLLLTCLEALEKGVITILDVSRADPTCLDVSKYDQIKDLSLFFRRRKDIEFAECVNGYIPYYSWTDFLSPLATRDVRPFRCKMLREAGCSST